MTTTCDLVNQRPAIREALKASVDVVQCEAALYDTANSSGIRSTRLMWLLSTGQQALKDLDYFWENMEFYSREKLPKYIAVSVIRLENAGQTRTSYKLQSLEHFWIVLLETGSVVSHGFLAVCSKAKRIEPSSENHPRLILRSSFNNAPSVESICFSAAVACIFLAKHKFGLGSYDIYSLLATILDHKDYSPGNPLPNLSESDLCPASMEVTSNPQSGSHLHPPQAWTSLQVPFILPVEVSESATKTFAFPSKFPLFKMDWRFMDIYQPHGDRPGFGQRCAVWGAWDSDSTSWDCFIACSDQAMGEKYVSCLSVLCMSAEQDFLSKLSSHWAEFVHYLCFLGINNARLAIRGAMETLYDLKYENAVNPRTGAAHACLMYKNHLEVFQELAQMLRKEIKTFPPSWRFTVTLDWAKDVEASCHALESELSRVYREAHSVRSMILEQLHLSQSGKMGVLTILASVFVPMSFVATFFGMNTKEINGTAWPITFYAAVAVPLTMVTVLVPLTALPALNVAMRLLRSGWWNRKTFDWGFMPTLFAMNLILDIDKYTNFLPSTAATILYSFASILGALVLVSLFGYFYWSLESMLRHDSASQGGRPLQGNRIRAAVYERWHWWPLIYFIAIALYISSIFQRFVELPVFLIYFFIRFWEARRKRASHVA